MVVVAQDAHHTQPKHGYKYSDVGLIPEDWDVVLLDAVAKRGSGHTPDKKHPEYWDGDIKWISLKDSDRLDALYISETTAMITPMGIAHSSAVLHPAGTVVLSRDAGVGKSAIMTDSMAVSQHFIAWQCGPRLNNLFLYYWLQAKKSEFERIAMGNTIKTIGLPYFKHLKIPLPSPGEQQAITSALRDVDTLLLELENLLNKKRNIKQATMQQLLTGKARLPGFSGEWGAKRLGEIAIIAMGRTPSRRNLQYWGRGHKWLSIADLKSKYIYETKEEITDAAAANMAAIPQGTLVMSFKLTIGKLAFTGTEMYSNEAICNFSMLRADAEYLYYVLGQTDFSLYGKQAVKGYTLNMESLNAIKVPFPPIPEQKAIAAVLADMDADIAAWEQRYGKTQAVKQAMMQELLTGRRRLV